MFHLSPGRESGSVSHVVDVSEGVQPTCLMLGAGFVKLRQRGSLCRRKLRRWDTRLRRRARVSEAKGVSPCIRIRPEGGDGLPAKALATAGAGAMGGNRYTPNHKGYIEDTAPEPPGQLYNLKIDPGETINLYLKK